MKVLHILALFAIAIGAQSAPWSTVQDTQLYFPATELGAGPSLQISGVAPQSANGGQVTLINTQVWTARYNGPANVHDQPLKVVVDGAGSVIVAGESDGFLTGPDFAVVKYAADGAALWTNRYTSLTNFGYWGDHGRGLTLDRAGNVYVSGTSGTTEWASDLVTLKYSSNGLPLWTNRFSVSSSNQLWLVDLTVDATESLYVVAHDYAVDFGENPGWLFKYDASGNLLWTNSLTMSAQDPYYASTVLTDSAGDVLVAGAGIDMSVLRYGADGTFKTSFGHGMDAAPTAMLIDQSDNVIIAADLWILGESDSHRYTIVKFATNGMLLWQKVFSTPVYQGGYLPDVAMDAAGNVFATLGSDDAQARDADYTTIKLNADGVPVWTNRFQYKLYTAGLGAGFSDSAVDNAGNYYLLCYSTAPGQSNNTDYVTLKLSPDGKILWTNRFDAGVVEAAHDLALDINGSVSVTGMSGPSWSQADFLTLKYADYILYTPRQGFVGTDSFTFSTVDQTGHTAAGMISITVLPAPLRLSSVAMSLEGFRMRLEGSATTNTAVILASSNLVHWTAIATNPPGTTEFTDAAALNLHQRFYKATSRIESSPP